MILWEFVMRRCPPIPGALSASGPLRRSPWGLGETRCSGDLPLPIARPFDAGRNRLVPGPVGMRRIFRYAAICDIPSVFHKTR
jgi:hypothetical protein